jgi:hypothetical protein
LRFVEEEKLGLRQEGGQGIGDVVAELVDAVFVHVPLE